MDINSLLRWCISVAVVKPMAQKGLAPSTYSASSAANMVEEVVKEVNDSRLKFRESGVLDLPYDQLSFAERINYELLFPKNVCEMLSRVIPAGIGLKSLEIDNFQTVYAVGLGRTGGAVTGVAAQSSEAVAAPFMTLVRLNASPFTSSSQLVKVEWAGSVAGFVGLYQVNAMIPKGVPAGDLVPIRIESGSRESQPGVTIAVK